MSEPIREAFEAWWKKENPHYVENSFTGPHKANAWKVWQAALSQPSESVPNGYVLVPREPTDKMLTAGYNAHEKTVIYKHELRQCYMAMLSAAGIAESVPDGEATVWLCKDKMSKAGWLTFHDRGQAIAFCLKHGCEMKSFAEVSNSPPSTKITRELMLKVAGLVWAKAAPDKVLPSAELIADVDKFLAELNQAQSADADRLKCDIEILCRAIYKLNHRKDESAIHNPMVYDGQLSDFTLMELTK